MKSPNGFVDKDFLHCPADNNNQQDVSSYAFNAQLGGSDARDASPDMLQANLDAISVEAIAGAPANSRKKVVSTAVQPKSVAGQNNQLKNSGSTTWYYPVQPGSGQSSSGNSQPGTGCDGGVTAPRLSH